MHAQLSSLRADACFEPIFWTVLRSTELGWRGAVESCRFVSKRAPSLPESKLDPDSSKGQRIDKGLDTEQVHFPANEIADPWLGHTKGGLSSSRTPS
jgi:hypothetical protein